MTKEQVLADAISIHALLAESDVAITIRGLVTPVISIHALLAESDFRGDHGHISGDISIHALLAESDLPRFPPGSEFPISIHALLAESDQSPVSLDPINIYNFYPRSPCGERQAMYTIWACTNKFLSTLSLRRATVLRHMHIYRFLISIHALLAESDGT